MRGRILTFDQLTGAGQISGEDNVRYHFQGTEWRAENIPAAGQMVDFEMSGGSAVDIYRIAAASGQVGDKSKIAAALLALFLGSLGIHKFYLGKSGAGLTMLLISVFGAILLLIPTMIMGIIAFIEFIIYLTMPDDEFDRRYISGNKAWF